MYSQKEKLKKLKKTYKEQEIPKRASRGDPPAFSYRRAIIHKSKTEKETPPRVRSIFGYRDDYNK